MLSVFYARFSQPWQYHFRASAVIYNLICLIKAENNRLTVLTSPYGIELINSANYQLTESEIVRWNLGRDFEMRYCLLLCILSVRLAIL